MAPAQAAAEAELGPNCSWWLLLKSSGFLHGVRVAIRALALGAHRVRMVDPSLWAQAVSGESRLFFKLTNTTAVRFDVGLSLIAFVGGIFEIMS